MEANTFQCSTLPPQPKPNDIAAAGEFFRDVICESLHRVPLPCGNYETAGNPVTVRIAPRNYPNQPTK